MTSLKEQDMNIWNVEYCGYEYDYGHRGYDTECNNFFDEETHNQYVKYCCFCGKLVKFVDEV